jgi:hypothetical protein
MQNDSSKDDLKTIWQNQPTEVSAMTVEQIRTKAQTLHSKVRRAVLGGIAVSLVIVAISGFGIAWAGESWARAGFAFSIAWTIAGQYFLNRKFWPEMMPTETASISGVESYRREIERQQYMSKRFLLWTFGPTVLAIGTLAFYLLHLARDQGALSQALPFTIMLFLWIAGVFVLRMRDRRHLQREIDDLAKMERASG